MSETEALEEELRFELLEDLTTSYRLSVRAQLFLYTILMLATILLVAYVPNIPLIVGISTILVTATILYPYIIKINNIYSFSLQISLYAGSLFSIFYLVYSYVQPDNLRTLSLILLFLEVMSIELLHHVYERLKLVKTKGTYVFTAIASIIFFVLLVEILFPIGLVLSVIFSAILTIIFAYAIFPERPF